MINTIKAIRELIKETVWTFKFSVEITRRGYTGTEREIVYNRLGFYERDEIMNKKPIDMLNEIMNVDRFMDKVGTTILQ